MHIISPAKKEIRKLDPSTQKSVLASCLTLGENPRPNRYKSIVGEKSLYRIHSGKYRIIYSILDRFEAVAILTVRPKDKDTYRNIPVQSLTDKLKELEASLNTD